jgi:hypothetical protein
LCIAYTATTVFDFGTINVIDTTSLPPSLLCGSDNGIPGSNVLGVVGNPVVQVTNESSVADSVSDWCSSSSCSSSCSSSDSNSSSCSSNSSCSSKRRCRPMKCPKCRQSRCKCLKPPPLKLPKCNKCREPPGCRVTITQNVCM